MAYPQCPHVVHAVVVVSCNCNEYIDCGDSNREGATSSGYEGYTHTYKNESTITNMPFAYTFKVDREFKCYFGWDRTIDSGYLVMCGAESITCDKSSTATPSCAQSESCIIETNVPYYIDRQRDIFVWKNVKESLSWSESSGGKTAKFRLKFGAGYFHKICIKNAVKTYGTETFKMSVKGVESILATQSYEYNPFPMTEGGGATWGLYGNTVQRSATPDTLDVAQILLFPLVPKQAIPQDNDVIAYGFYDYNSTEGGFTECSLPKDDGGKDYFYPYWCRQMPYDALWRETADVRYGMIYSLKENPVGVAGTASWTPPPPIVNEFPFGSLAFDSESNFMASMLLQFGQHVDSKGVVYNKASFGDLFTALGKSVTLKEYTKFDPIAPI